MPYTPERTRARIFEAAVDEFAAHGFAGARVDRIAAGARANKQAIYLYFGDKRRLFGLVLEDQLGRLDAAVPRDAAGDLREYVRRLFEFMRRDRRFLRLLMWEALEFGEGPVPGEDVRAGLYRDRAAFLRAARREGRVDASVPEEALWLAAIGMVSWFFAVPQVARMTLGRTPTEADVERHGDHLVELIGRLTAPR
jgi:AcrR family transcriptional regulator